MTELPSGSVIADRYRILRVLGRGGVGTTYEAELSLGGERFALKHVVLSGLREWKSYELFEREARVLSALSHPSIPRYREHFMIEKDGETSFVLVQELAPGRTLAQWVADGWRPTEQEVRGIALHLLLVLRALHERHPPLIHRDLKPENLVRDDAGVVRLVDFGAVRDTYRSLSGGTTMVGTYGYMAPEQLHGEARPESDLYGLGATLLFLLSGRSPADLPRERLKIAFRGRVQTSNALAAWLDCILAPVPEERFGSAQLAHSALRDGMPKPRLPLRTIARMTAVGAIFAGSLIYAGVTLRNRALGHTTSALTHTPTRPATAGDEIVRFERGFPAHMSAVFSVAFTPDGDRLATGSFDGTAKLWDMKKSDVVRAYAGHTATVGGVAITRDGRRLVTSGDTTVRLWDVETGALTATMRGDARRTTALAITPDGDTAVSGGFEGSAKVFNLDARTQVGTLPHSPGNGRVLSVAVSPDGRLFATAGDDKRVVLWDASTRALIRTLSGHDAPIGALAWAPDGQILASAGDDHSVRFWHAASGSALRTLRVNGDEVYALAFSPSGSVLAIGDKKSHFVVVDAMTGRVDQDIETGGAYGVLSIAFSADGLRVATGHGDGSVRLWRTGPLPPVTLPEHHLVLGAPDPPLLGSAEQVTIEGARRLLDSYSGRSEVFAEAEKTLNAVTAANGRSAEAYVQLGRAAFKRAHHSGDDYETDGLATARALADKALAISPHLASALALRGWIYLAQKDTKRATEIAAEAEAADKDSIPALRIAGETAMVAKDLDGAERRARAIVERARELQQVVSGYGLLQDVYRIKGDSAARDLVYQRKIELEPDSAWTKGDYAGFLVWRGDCDRAVANATAALALMDYGAARATLADAYACKGNEQLWDHQDYDQARATFERAIVTYKNAPSGWYGLGASHAMEAVRTHDRAHFKAARAAYEKALAVDPGFRLARQELGELP